MVGSPGLCAVMAARLGAATRPVQQVAAAELLDEQVAFLAHRRSACWPLPRRLHATGGLICAGPPARGRSRSSAGHRPRPPVLEPPDATRHAEQMAATCRVDASAQCRELGQVTMLRLRSSTDPQCRCGTKRACSRQAQRPLSTTATDLARRAAPLGALPRRLGREPRLGQRRLQVLDQVGLFPREEVALRLAAEMAVGGGRAVDRLVERRDACGCRAGSGRRACSILPIACLDLRRRRPCRCRACRRRATAARTRRSRRRAGSCSAGRGRRRRCSWRGSARHRRPSGRPWSGPCRENAPPPCGAAPP